MPNRSIKSHLENDIGLEVLMKMLYCDCSSKVLDVAGLELSWIVALKSVFDRFCKELNGRYDLMFRIEMPEILDQLERHLGGQAETFFSRILEGALKREYRYKYSDWEDAIAGFYFGRALLGPVASALSNEIRSIFEGNVETPVDAFNRRADTRFSKYFKLTRKDELLIDVEEFDYTEIPPTPIKVIRKNFQTMLYGRFWFEMDRHIPKDYVDKLYEEIAYAQLINFEPTPRDLYYIYFIKGHRI